MYNKVIIFPIIVLSAIFISACCTKKKISDNYAIDDIQKIAQQKSPKAKQAKNNNKDQVLFLCPERNNKVQHDFIEKNRIPSHIVIYQDEFFSKKTKYLDLNELKRNLDTFIPNINDTNYASLDWEYKSFDTIVCNIKTTEKEYKKTLNNFTSLITYAKKLRPKMKWSYYNLNVTPYLTETRDAYMERTKKMLPLLEQLDYLAPSIYIYYDNLTQENKNKMLEFSKMTADYSLELGYKLNKPVYFFVWNRYTPGNKRMQNKLVGEDYFKENISVLLRASYENKIANGIFWWICEEYMYKNQEVMQADKSEYKNVKDIKKYQINIIDDYWTVIKGIFK